MGERQSDAAALLPERQRPVVAPAKDAHAPPHVPAKHHPPRPSKVLSDSEEMLIYAESEAYAEPQGSSPLQALFNGISLFSTGTTSCVQ